MKSIEFKRGKMDQRRMRKNGAEGLLHKVSIIKVPKASCTRVSMRRCQRLSRGRLPGTFLNPKGNNHKHFFPA